MGVSAVQPHPVVRESVRLAALRVLYLDVRGREGADCEQFAVVEAAACRLDTADQWTLL